VGNKFDHPRTGWAAPLEALARPAGPRSKFDPEPDPSRLNRTVLVAGLRRFAEDALKESLSIRSKHDVRKHASSVDP
jgi:hypothetical protein